MEICFKLRKVIRRSVVPYCLKDISLSARFLDSSSGVVGRPGPWDVILCRLIYKLPTFFKDSSVFETSGTVYK
jgi:hypothetical protein